MAPPGHPVERGGGALVLVVGKTGACNYQRLRPSPNRFEHTGDRRRRHVAGEKLEQHDLSEHFLDKGQLDLKAVLGGVRALVDQQPGARQWPLLSPRLVSPSPTRTTLPLVAVSEAVSARPARLALTVPLASAGVL